MQWIYYIAFGVCAGIFGPISPRASNGVDHSELLACIEVSHLTVPVVVARSRSLLILCTCLVDSENYLGYWVASSHYSSYWLPPTLIYLPKLNREYIARQLCANVAILSIGIWFLS